MGQRTHTTFVVTAAATHAPRDAVLSVYVCIWMDDLKIQKNIIIFTAK